MAQQSPQDSNTVGQEHNGTSKEPGLFKCTLCYDTGMVTYGGPIGSDEDGNTEYDAWEEPCDCEKGIAFYDE